MKHFGLLFVPLTLMFGGVAQAQQVLYTNFGPGFTYNSGFEYLIADSPNCAFPFPESEAVQFRPPVNAFFQDAIVALGVDSGTNEMSLYLESDAGGLPGAIIEGPINVTNLATTGTGSVVTAPSMLHPFLLSGTPYWLVVTVPNANTCAGWFFNSTGDTTNGTTKVYDDVNGSPTGPWTFSVPRQTRPAFQIDGVPDADIYQVRYFSNVNSLGGSLINLTNTGANAGATGTLGFSGGNICVNIYVFDPNEEELECCSCQITPNALQSISVQALLSQNLTPEKPDSTVVKLLATALTGATCDPTTAGSAANPLVPGLRAWGHHAAQVRWNAGLRLRHRDGVFAGWVYLEPRRAKPADQPLLDYQSGRFGQRPVQRLQHGRRSVGSILSDTGLVLFG